MRSLSILVLSLFASTALGQIQQGYDPAGWPGITPPEAKPITEAHLDEVHYMDEVLVPDLWDAIVGHPQEMAIAVVLLECEDWLASANERGGWALQRANSCLPWEDDENYTLWIVGGIEGIWRDNQGQADACLHNAGVKYDEAFNMAF